MKFFDIPEDNEFYRNTNEGGLMVVLIAFDEHVEPYSYEPAIRLSCNEVFIGADKDFPQVLVEYDVFPQWGIKNKRFNEVLRYAAALYLGKTIWSGSGQDGKYWKCSYADLTVEGKILYTTLERNFPESKINLLTFLYT